MPRWTSGAQKWQARLHFWGCRELDGIRVRMWSQDWTQCQGGAMACGRGTVLDGGAAAVPAPLGLRLWACEPACLWVEKREDEAGDQVKPDRCLNFLLGVG